MGSGNHPRPRSRETNVKGPNPSGLCKCGCGQRTPIAKQSSARSGHVAGEPVSFMHGHHRRGLGHSQTSRKKMSLAQKKSWASLSAEERKRGPMPQSQRDNISKSRLGEKHWAWKPLGSKIEYGHGYIAIKTGFDHPMANSKGYVAEHRLVMSEHLGRPLRSDEDVHHINGNTTDNRIENLELIAHNDHSSMQRRKLHSVAINSLLDLGHSEAEVAGMLHMTPETIRRYKK